MALLRRLVIGLSVGLGCVLAACGVAANIPATPAQRMQLGCFHPLDAAPGGGVPRVSQATADATARAFYEQQNGAFLLRTLDSAGNAQPAPPIEARYLSIRSSDYGSSGQGGGGGSDPLRGRSAWLLGYAVDHMAPWSTYHAGSTVYMLVDAQTAVPLLTCSGPDER